jgi:hypothetical protein
MTVRLNLGECANALYDRTQSDSVLRRFVTGGEKHEQLRLNIAGLSQHVIYQAACILEAGAKCGQTREAEQELPTLRHFVQLDNENNLTHINNGLRMPVLQVGNLFIPMRSPQLARAEEWLMANMHFIMERVDESVSGEEVDMESVSRFALINSFAIEVRDAVENEEFAQLPFVKPIAEKRWPFGGSRENPIPRQG